MLDFLFNRKYGSGRCCPKCGSENIREGARVGYKPIRGSVFSYRCRNCGYDWIQ